MKRTAAFTLAMLTALGMAAAMPSAGGFTAAAYAESDEVVTDEMDIITMKTNADSKEDEEEETVKEWNGFQYRVRKDGLSVRIIGYKGKDTSVTFPGKIDGMVVANVQGDIRFNIPASVKEVKFDTGIKSINWPLFANNTGIEKVTISGTVKTVGSQTFVGCTNLKEVTIQQGVGRIETEAFKNTGIKEISIPGGTVIGANAFSNCKSLEKVVLHEGTKSIGSGAFAYCPNLKEVYIPNSVTNIPNNIGVGLMNDPFWIGKEQKYPANLVIYGYPGSKAEKYAQDEKRNITFKLHPDLSGSGDVNKDGNIDVTDISMVASHIKGIKALDEQDQTNADVNNSKTIDVTDISMIASHIKGIKPL